MAATANRARRTNIVHRRCCSTPVESRSPPIPIPVSQSSFARLPAEAFTQKISSSVRALQRTDRGLLPRVKLAFAGSLTRVVFRFERLTSDPRVLEHSHMVSKVRFLVASYVPHRCPCIACHRDRRILVGDA